jgi:hypothetical protein
VDSRATKLPRRKGTKTLTEESNSARGQVSASLATVWREENEGDEKKKGIGNGLLLASSLIIIIP